MASRRRSGGRGGRKGYYWDGVQFPRTAIVSGGNAQILVDSPAQEFMPATVVRIRGHMVYTPSSDAVNEVFSKIAYVEVNDAGNITGDMAGIDTSEEDIAVRQLWTHVYGQAAVTLSARRTSTVEVDVKVKIKLESSGKKKLILFIDTVTTGRTDVSGYLRVLLQHG